MALALELGSADIENYETIRHFGDELGLSSDSQVQAIGIQTAHGQDFDRTLRNWVRRDGNVSYETHAWDQRTALLVPPRPPLPGVRMLQIVEAPEGIEAPVGLNRVHFSLTRLSLDQTVELAESRDVSPRRYWSGLHMWAEVLLPDQPDLGLVMHDHDMERFHFQELKKQHWLGADTHLELGGGVSVHRVVDDELLETGEYLTIEDFRAVARDCNYGTAVAARAFDKIALTLAKTTADDRISGWLERVITDPYFVIQGSREHILLSTQAVKDLYDSTEHEGQKTPGFGPKTHNLLRVVLEDTQITPIDISI